MIPIIAAILAALTYSFGSFLKRPTTDGTKEPFSIEKMFVTVCIALIVGVVSWYMGTTADVTTQVLTSAGLIANIEIWGKSVYRKLKTWFDARI